MVLAVEPMTTAGRPAVRVAGDGWAIFSQDGSLAAHFEFTVAITAAGPRVLTPWHLAPSGPRRGVRSRARRERERELTGWTGGRSSRSCYHPRVLPGCEVIRARESISSTR